MRKSIPIPEIITYQPDHGWICMEVRLQDENVWLTQAQMVELFQTTKQNISLHLRNLLKERKINEKPLFKYYLTAGADGKTYEIKHYNLQAIIAVNNRVRSHRGTQFCDWATEQITNYHIHQV